jgi:hypothetical protein
MATPRRTRAWAAREVALLAADLLVRWCPVVRAAGVVGKLDGPPPPTVVLSVMPLLENAYLAAAEQHPGLCGGQPAAGATAGHPSHLPGKAVASNRHGSRVLGAGGATADAFAQALVRRWITEQLSPDLCGSANRCWWLPGRCAVLVMALNGGDDLGGPVRGMVVSEEVGEVIEACAAFCGGKCQGLLQGVDEIRG